MGQSLHQVYGHLVFSTKERRSFIHADIENKLYAYISGIIKNLGGNIIAINGMPDHIHIIVKSPKNTSDVEFIKQIKGGSSKWMNDNSPKPFQWQSGYAWFSISTKDLPAAIEYVAKQKEHHQKVSFKDELRKFLNSYNIEYDEEYLWD